MNPITLTVIFWKDGAGVERSEGEEVTEATTKTERHDTGNCSDMHQ